MFHAVCGYEYMTIIFRAVTCKGEGSVGGDLGKGGDMERQYGTPTSHRYF